jgi:hypothetical protein
MIDFPVLLELVTYAVAIFTLGLEEKERFLLFIVVVIIVLQYTISYSSAHSILYTAVKCPFSYISYAGTIALAS